MKWILIIVVLTVLGSIGFFVEQKYAPVTRDTVDTTDTAPVTNDESDASEAVQDTSSGTSLNLSGQGLNKVPSYVFSQKELTSLNLSHNQLTGALQAEVRHLSNLEVLDLSDNQFTGVPAEVGQLSHLVTLDLSSNQLTGLPHELANLSNLKTLDLRGNNPSSFDLDIIRQALPSTTILVD